MEMFKKLYEESEFAKLKAKGPKQDDDDEIKKKAEKVNSKGSNPDKEDPNTDEEDKEEDKKLNSSKE